MNPHELNLRVIIYYHINSIVNYVFSYNNQF